MDKFCSFGCLKQVDPSEANVMSWTFSYSLVEISSAPRPPQAPGNIGLNPSVTHISAEANLQT